MILTGLAAAPLLHALWQPNGEPGLTTKPPAPQVHPQIDPRVSPQLAVASEPSPPYVVQIVGKNFRWHFQVLKPAESKVSSVLRLPAGARIQWRLTSSDYIYAFRIPELQINMMAVPRIISTAVTEATPAMSIDLLVDPLCNFRLYHDEWMGRVEIGAASPKIATEDRS